jgi:hypothetical protein
LVEAGTQRTRKNETERDSTPDGDSLIEEETNETKVGFLKKHGEAWRSMEKP